MNRFILSKLLSEWMCSSQFNLHWVSPHSPSPSMRIVTHLWTFCFLESIFVFWGILSTSMFFCRSNLLGDRPKLTWGMQRLCGHFVFKTIVMPFESDTCWSFYFYTSGTFYPILTLFTQFALHQFFHDAEYCFLTPDDAVDRQKATVSLVCFFLFFYFFGFWWCIWNNPPSQIIVTLC